MASGSDPGAFVVNPLIELISEHFVLVLALIVASTALVAMLSFRWGFRSFGQYGKQNWAVTKGILALILAIGACFVCFGASQGLMQVGPANWAMRGMVGEEAPVLSWTSLDASPESSPEVAHGTDATAEPEATKIAEAAESAGEAAAVAVAYAVFVAFFVLRTMRVSDLPEILSRAGLTSAVVLLLVGAALAFKTVVSLSYAPQILADFILTLSENPLVLLFLINLLLFIVGMFLDAGPAIIILGPILGPIFVDLGVDPIHFAIIMSVNLTVGLATPPMGLVLFVAAAVSREKVETIAKAILPFLAIEIAVIFLITYVPAISMTIPRLTGFAN